MVDLRIRKNEVCVIGLPQCNYVFSSTNSCFIAYGFNTSALEKGIIARILTEKGIEPIEAETRLQSGQFAFCTKICSKIITSRFCIVLLNEDTISHEGASVNKPNASVNIEYGQMIGFNKFIIPFQHEKFSLPFNVNGLDTVKYNERNFEQKAIEAIDDAIIKTSPSQSNREAFPVILGRYLLSKNALIAKLSDSGERDVYALGESCDFNLLTSLNALSYIYFGQFPQLSNDAIKWRIDKLAEIIKVRRDSIPERLALGIIAETHANLVYRLFDELKIWILVGDEEARRDIVDWYETRNLSHPLEVVTLDMVMSEGAGRF